MDYTDNYNLKKPADTDERKISDLNDNADIIDAALNTLATTEATTSARGMMSAADKTKLNGIAASANNYSLPLAANGTRGGAQIGYTQNGKNYPVQLSSEKMYVNVPWENTTYSAATTSAAGLMSAADKTKLNGIATSANNYSLPLAASGTRGGVQIGYSQNGKNYPVLQWGDSMEVNVAWTVTVYTMPTAASGT